MAGQLDVKLRWGSGDSRRRSRWDGVERRQGRPDRRVAHQNRIRVRDLLYELRNENDKANLIILVRNQGGAA